MLILLILHKIGKIAIFRKLGLRLSAKIIKLNDFAEKTGRDLTFHKNNIFYEN